MENYIMKPRFNDNEKNNCDDADFDASICNSISHFNILLFNDELRNRYTLGIFFTEQ